MSLNIIGHRGARGLATENTLAAIEAGIAAGATMVEVDVRVTKDGIPILWHDPARQNHRIADNPWYSLKKLFPDMVTLEDAVRAINHQTPIIIEIKPGERTDPIISVLKNLLRQGWQPKDFMLASFSQSTLLTMHKALPLFDTIVIESWSGFWATHRARQLGTPYICMNHHFLWWGFVKSMTKKYKLAAYALNDPKKADRWTRYGLWAVVTDYPDRFVDLNQ